MEKLQLSKNGEKIHNDESSLLKEIRGTNLKMDNLDTVTEVEPIDGTPFALVRYDNKYFIGVANYRVSEIYKEKHYALAWVNNITWEKITQLIFALSNTIMKPTKTENK